MGLVKRGCFMVAGRRLRPVTMARTRSCRLTDGVGDDGDDVEGDEAQDDVEYGAMEAVTGSLVALARWWARGPSGDVIVG